MAKYGELIINVNQDALGARLQDLQQRFEALLALLDDVALESGLGLTLTVTNRTGETITTVTASGNDDVISAFARNILTRRL